MLQKPHLPTTEQMFKPPKSNMHAKQYVKKVATKMFVLIVGFFLFFIFVFIFLGIAEYFQYKRWAQQNPTTQSPIVPSPSLKATPFDGEFIGNAYVNKTLGFSVPKKAAAGIPIITNYGKRVEIKWPTFQITVGYWYATDGHLMSAKEVISRHALRVKEYGGTLKTVQQINNNNSAVYKLEVSANDFPEWQQNNKSFEVASIENGEVVYELFAYHNGSSVSILNPILSGFQLQNANFETIRTHPAQPTTIAPEIRVFFPPDEKTITTAKPTIIGKIRQSKNVYLTTEFGIKPLSYNDDVYHFMLLFHEGFIQNMHISLDGQPVTHIFGFPQFPTVICHKIHGNGPITSDNYLYGESLNYEPFVTEKECLDRKTDELPPVIFMFNPEQSLQTGKHTIIITSPDVNQTVTFFVDPKASIANQSLPDLGEKNEYGFANLLDDTENCMSGYYYPRNYLHIPLPTFNNPDILYQLSFPQSEDEKGNINRQKVIVQFEKQRFNLLLPQSSIFYFPDELNLKNHQKPNEWYALYLPTEYLYFTNGSKATVWVRKGYNASEYFELFPTDVLGTEYRNNSIPRDTTAFSGCDG